MIEEKTILTAEQAIEMFPEGETIHTFINPSGMLIGADWSRKEAIKAVKKALRLELAGEQAMKMNHGLAVWRSEYDLVFMETRKAA